MNDSLAWPRISLTTFIDADDGEVTGLAEQITELQRDFGELFEPADTAKSSGEHRKSGRRIRAEKARDGDQGDENRKPEGELPASTRQAVGR